MNIEIFNKDQEQNKKNNIIDCEQLKNIYLKYGKSNNHNILEENNKRLNYLINEFKREYKEYNKLNDKYSQLNNKYNKLKNKNIEKKKYIIQLINKKV